MKSSAAQVREKQAQFMAPSKESRLAAGKISLNSSNLSVQPPIQSSSEEVAFRINRILDIVKSGSTGSGSKADSSKKLDKKKAKGKASSKGHKESLFSPEEADEDSEGPMSLPAKAGKSKGKSTDDAKGKGGKQGGAASMWRPKSQETHADCKADELAPADDLPQRSETRGSLNSTDSRVTWNPDAPVFVPVSEVAVSPVDEQAYWAYNYWPQGMFEGGPSESAESPQSDMAFPEVVPGLREGEFVGLQSIAEMGEWVVLREKKPKALPFFWNMMTLEKTWEAPQIIKDAGVAELLKEWSQDLSERGIEPHPEALYPDSYHRRRNNKPRVPREFDPSDEDGEGEKTIEETGVKQAPPGFVAPTPAKDKESALARPPGFTLTEKKAVKTDDFAIDDSGPWPSLFSDEGLEEVSGKVDRPSKERATGKAERRSAESKSSLSQQVAERSSHRTPAVTVWKQKESQKEQEDSACVETNERDTSSKTSAKSSSGLKWKPKDDNAPSTDFAAGYVGSRLR